MYLRLLYLKSIKFCLILSQLHSASFQYDDTDWFSKM